MEFTTANPSIENKVIQGTESLYFTFNGTLTSNDAITAIDTWKEKALAGNKKYMHIWNCVNMTGYEPMARVAWQKALKELKNHIDKIWLVSDSSIIIAGAKLLSLFTSLEIKPVKSEEHIQL